MATTYTTNFPIPGADNIFQLIWKLTRTMKASGWTTQASSDGVAKETTGGTSDKWGSHVSPLSDVYVTDTNNLTDSTTGGWIVLRGPSTIKMPINANPSGTLIRGEVITQATTNAEGELVGYVWDFVGLTGWAVIMPHTGTFNMTTANTITGTSSQTTFAPLTGGTMVTYVREMMFARSTSSADVKTKGVLFYICADASAESAQLFTNLAAQSGCTATVPPGGGGTGNAFPTNGLVLKGTSALSYNTWFGSSINYMATNNGQIGCLNATPATQTTADGSFYACCSNNVSANGVDGFLFTRLDDTEPGDVDPYAFYCYSNNSLANYTGNTVGVISTTSPVFKMSQAIGNTAAAWFGYAARGCPVSSRDIIAQWVGTVMSGSNIGGGATYMMNAGGVNPITILNHPSTSPPELREPIMLALGNGASSGIPNSSKQVKGRARWLQLGPPLGTSYDTYDNKAWLVVSVATSGVGVLLLPYDGATVPTQ